MCRGTRSGNSGRQESDQFVIDNLDDLLTRRDRAKGLLTVGFLFDAGDELLDDLEVNVCIKQCAPDIFHRLADVIFRQLSLTF